jgi:hypothetical protein
MLSEAKIGSTYRPSLTATEQTAVATAQAVLRQALANANGSHLSWVRSYTASNGWALAADALRVLVSLVAAMRPQHILEFGSGSSTQVMARACEELQLSCAITSIDHDPQYGVMAAQALTAQPDSPCQVRFQIAPLVARDHGGKFFPTYHLDTACLASTHAAELILIDGPSVMLGGREGILYQALGFARAGTIVLLDDAKRAEEQAAIANWQHTLGEAIEVHLLPGFIKGLAAIIVHVPVIGADLASYRLNAVTEELLTLIPPGCRCILVGEAWWGDAAPVDCDIIPFLERNGQYWGPPGDDATAVAEFNRLYVQGADFIVFRWTSFWWLDFYAIFRRHLENAFSCVLHNDRLIVFDLRR